ncbi:MAG: hypothetical protein KF689_09615 [Gemmatimonadaceae bacterium]|nr:hypothetical protein [Gemmatimonadaceae bacterium]MCW5826144.1 hypothetical protein [Gemmatimonadaceae bacterium]
MTTTRTGRRGLAAALALVASLSLWPVQALDAQIIRVPDSDDRQMPVTVHGSFGYFVAQNRFDGRDQLTWFLGDAYQIRLGADAALGIGSVGLSGTLATVPIQRGNSTASRGDIQLRQVFAMFRSPEPQGFGQVVQFGIGISQWANYSGTDVLTESEAAARNALAIGLSYGFALPLGKRFSLTLVQDYVTAVGSREGLPASARRSQEQYTTRLGLRYKVLGVRE